MQILEVWKNWWWKQNHDRNGFISFSQTYYLPRNFFELGRVQINLRKYCEPNFRGTIFLQAMNLTNIMKLTSILDNWELFCFLQNLRLMKCFKSDIMVGDSWIHLFFDNRKSQKNDNLLTIAKLNFAIR